VFFILLFRACYLLENDTHAYNLHNFLICQAYNEDDSDSMCPTSVRLSALQCLCLATTKNIEEITCRTKEMMKYIVLICNISKLHCSNLICVFEYI